jgi:hypothetical protein
MPALTVRDVTLAILAARASEATVCPSEVARALTLSEAEAGGTCWRESMPAVHEAIDGLVADGTVQLSWKGETLPSRSGPYRIGWSQRTRKDRG